MRFGFPPSRSHFLSEAKAPSRSARKAFDWRSARIRVRVWWRAEGGSSHGVRREAWRRRLAPLQVQRHRPILHGQICVPAILALGRQFLPHVDAVSFISLVPAVFPAGLNFFVKILSCLLWIFIVMVVDQLQPPEEFSVVVVTSLACVECHRFYCSLLSRSLIRWIVLHLVIPALLFLRSFSPNMVRFFICFPIWPFDLLFSSYIKHLALLMKC